MKSRQFTVFCSIGIAALAVAAVLHFSSDARPVPVCTVYSGLPDGFGHRPAAGMLRVPGGQLTLGSASGYRDELPVPMPVTVQAFWMDRTEVTNAQFSAFVTATGYVTDAEREGAGAVFRPTVPGAASQGPSDWWAWTAGANWRQPEGAQRSTAAVANEPVVLITRADAMAYAQWLGHDLPTEAEWEWAARGGGSAERVDREPRDPAGRPVANYWQGIFPDLNTKEDGFAALAPVGCFAANGYGLFDMIGNVWELTRDFYAGAHQPHGNGTPAASAKAGGGSDRQGKASVIKGGSFMCAASYCIRYRAAARHPQEADLPTSHAGFRTVLRDAGVPASGP